MPDWLRSVLGWFAILMMLGGVVVGVASVVLDKTATLWRRLDPDARPRGWIDFVILGLAMMVAGYLLLAVLG